MSRKLTDEEQQLWENLRQTVKPLSRVRKSDAESTGISEHVRADAPPAKKPKPPTGRAKRAPSAPAAQPTITAALAPLEERTRRRLSRGLVEVDARIDLHGMRQERAFNALVSFLRKAQSHGDRIVLVVTGKGRGGDDGRGVLRQSVPAWLSRADLRDLVVGWNEAGRRHGGAGALYVRVRRRREGHRASRDR